MRDYIHVVDLAKAHVKAIEYLQNPKVNPLIANLGCGKGYSVLEMVQAFSQACGREIPYQIAPRRPGDIVECYAKEQLNCQGKLTIKEMCQDSWHWQSTNPQGY